jgi:hypothetical protein
MSDGVSTGVKGSDGVSGTPVYTRLITSSTKELMDMLPCVKLSKMGRVVGCKILLLALSERLY